MPPIQAETHVTVHRCVQAMRTSSRPSTDTTSPARSCRPRRSSGSPLTRTAPVSRTSLTWAPVGTASTSLSSCPRRIESSPGRREMVRTGSVSGADELVTDRDRPRYEHRRRDGEQPAALPVDRLEDAGVAADRARLRPGHHDAPRYRSPDVEQRRAQPGARAHQVVLAHAVEDDVHAEPSAVPAAERAGGDKGDPGLAVVVEGPGAALERVPAAGLLVIVG